MSKLEYNGAVPATPEAAEFAKLVLESLELERQGRMEASDNSSHDASIEDFAVASKQVAKLLQHA